MEFKDASPDIAAVSQNYNYTPAPNWLLRVQELIQQVLVAVQEFIESLFRTHKPVLSDSRGLSNVMQVGIYIAGAVALIVICYLLWKRAKRASEVEESTRRGASAIEKILDSDGYRQDSKRLAEQANFRGACRSLYLCLLQLMHEKNVTIFAPAKTNYEYRYLLLPYPQLQAGFKQIADTVELIWFGNKEADAGDYEQCSAVLQQLEPLLEKISDEKARAAAALEGAYE